MTTDEAHAAYCNMSFVMVRLSKGEKVVLEKRDLDWLADIHLLLPDLPLPHDRVAA